MTRPLTHSQQTALAAAEAAEAAYRAGLEDLERRRNARNDAVRQALRVGVRAADIARALELTKSRIGQIKAAA